jgi:hypothetical protein
MEIGRHRAGRNGVNLSMIRSRIREYMIRRRHRTTGQSLVEFTILLPVLLIMISGLIEFGFLLNYYLDLIDAAREAARWGAGDDPIHDDISGAYIDPNPNFYGRVFAVAETSIDTGSGGQISLDPLTDNIVVSAFGISGGVVDERYPNVDGDLGRCFYNYPACNHNSDFTTAEVNALLDPSAPNTGIVLVEMWYDYHMILGLPWITLFVPDPVTLYAYSWMPNANAEPTPTPGP